MRKWEMLQKTYISKSHNLFLLGKRKPTRYLTLQADQNVSIYDIYSFSANGPKYGNKLQDSPKK